MKNILYFLVLLFFMVNSFNCSNTNKSDINNKKTKVLKVNDKEKILSLFNDYISYYNEKNIDKIISLYSANHKKGLLNKNALNEIFNISTKLLYTTSQIQIIKIDNNRFQINYILNKQITIVNKLINETSENQLIIVKENNNWKLFDDQIKKIIK